MTPSVTPWVSLPCSLFPRSPASVPVACSLLPVFHTCIRHHIRRSASLLLYLCCRRSPEAYVRRASENELKNFFVVLFSFALRYFFPIGATSNHTSNLEQLGVKKRFYRKWNRRRTGLRHDRVRVLSFRATHHSEAAPPTGLHSPQNLRSPMPAEGTAAGARPRRCAGYRRVGCSAASSPARGWPSPSRPPGRRGRRGGGGAVRWVWGAR